MQGDWLMDYRVEQNGYELFIEQRKNSIKQQILEQYMLLRKEKAITQQEIAERTGMKRTNIARIESGKNMPTIEVLIKLATALDMELKISLVDKNEKIEESIND